LAAGLAAAGALFFFASDMLLAYNRYGRNFPRGQLLIRILYHLGQMGIVSAVVVKYLSGPLH
jgi:hypothetical protein